MCRRVHRLLRRCPRDGRDCLRSIFPCRPFGRRRSHSRSRLFFGDSLLLGSFFSSGPAFLPAHSQDGFATSAMNESSTPEPTATPCTCADKPTPQEIDRRKFLTWLSVSLGGLCAAVIG